MRWWHPPVDRSTFYSCYCCWEATGGLCGFTAAYFSLTFLWHYRKFTIKYSHRFDTKMVQYQYFVMSFSFPKQHPSRLIAHYTISHITVAKRSQISEVIMEIISPLKWIRSCPCICLIKHQMSTCQWWKLQPERHFDFPRCRFSIPVLLCTHEMGEEKR